jgi:hypothetical protein
MTMDTMTTGDSDGGGCPCLFQSTARIDRVMGDAAFNRRHQNRAEGDENITINHGCGGAMVATAVTAATAEAEKATAALAAAGPTTMETMKTTTAVTAETKA